MIPPNTAAAQSTLFFMIPHPPFDVFAHGPASTRLRPVPELIGQWPFHMQDDVAQPFKRSLTPGVGGWGYHVTGPIRLADGSRANQVLFPVQGNGSAGDRTRIGEGMRNLALPVELRIHAPGFPGYYDM